MLTLTTRSQKETAPGSGRFESVHEVVRWDPRKTAIVICDMWDKHWCDGATGRVGEMAPVMNAVVRSARQQGVFIVHAPSDTMEFYQDAPQRRRALESPKVALPKELERPTEPPLPIDDSDGGCDTDQKPWYKAWSRQHPTLEIASEDAISDNGDEVYRLFKQRGIDNVILMGVHTNMCVLGRSFAIRRMVKLGMNVLLMRDMTDTMYNPKMRPYVSHVRGTDLVVEHIERHWCPSITSTPFTGKPSFRFKEDQRPRVTFVLSEDEYRAKDTLPPFARTELEEKRDFRCTYLRADSKTDIPGLDALEESDLAVFYIRRRTLPEEQLDRIKSYLAEGLPLVALRTSSHAFENWKEFDPQVLGGHYRGHHSNRAPENPTRVQVADTATDHPILTGLSRDAFLAGSTLYQVSPLVPTATPLLIGRLKGDEPAEPVAWVNDTGRGRVFYTSLGHPDDFAVAPFRRLLVNGILWALDRPIPTD